MSSLRWQQERRSEVRRPEPTRRISWTHESPTKLYTGWMSDTANSGLAFVTPTRDQPSPGEVIELTFGAGRELPQHERVRVVRAAPYDRFFSLVGCIRERVEESVHSA